MNDVDSANINYVRRPCRRAPIHWPIHDHANRANIVFVTLCTQHRKPILAHDDIHALMIASWRAHRAWIVGRYVIMPDHVHLFCAPGVRDQPPLVRWVSAWKAYVSRNWPRPDERPVWQRSFWDRQMRQSESYGAKWTYVQENPVRQGLVAVSEAWPFHGEIEALLWHDP